jgi:glycine hydroxymethyltransferase
MVDIANFFKKLLVDEKDPKKVKKEVASFKKDFQEVKYCFQNSNEAYQYLEFY